MKSPFRLDGRVALITGGSSGIGEATARAFHAAGAAVLILGIDRERGRRVAESLPGSAFIECDITDETAVDGVFADLDRLDVLVNNAGIGFVGSVEETALEDFERLFRVNVTGMFLVTRAALGLLKASHGAIVNVGSVAGSVGVKRRFGYCATKGAVHAMTRQLAVDYPTEFRVNAVAPGTIDTPFVESFLEKFHKHEKEQVREQLRARQPMGRLGLPEEIANLVLYLACDESAFMNGSILPIDGGWSAA